MTMKLRLSNCGNQLRHIVILEIALVITAHIRYFGMVVMGNFPTFVMQFRWTHLWNQV